MKQRVFHLMITASLLTGCNESVQTLCKEFPKTRAEFEMKVASLPAAKLARQKKGRKIASVVASVTEPWSENDRQDWMKYSEAWLKKSQNIRDQLEGYSAATKAHHALGEASDLLVFLYGYAERGERDRVRDVAIRYQKKMDEVAKLGCGVVVEE